MKTLLCLLGTVAPLAHATAQNVLVVDSAGASPYQQIQSAIIAAAPGDRIDVLPGTYTPFTADKELTIRSVTPQSVRVTDANGLLAQTDVRLVPPPGQHLRIIGIDFAYPNSGWSNFSILEIRGRVSMERCTVCYNLGMQVTDAQLHLQGCDLSALYAGVWGMLASSSDITASETIIRTNTGAVSPFTGMLPTLALASSRLFASHCTLQGANHLSLSGNQSLPALDVDSYSSAYLSDCHLQAGSNCPIIGTGAVESARCTFTGAGTFVTGTCIWPQNNSDLVGARLSSPLSLGSSVSAEFTTAAGGLVFVLAADRLATIELPGVLGQPSWLDPASVFAPAVVAAAPNGTASFSFVVPANTALVGATLWLEGVGLRSGALPVSPVVGGVVVP